MIGYLVAVYQEVVILFSLIRWMETVLVRECFVRYSNFVHKLNCNFGWKPGNRFEIISQFGRILLRKFTVAVIAANYLKQGCQTQFLEGRSPAEFRCNPN